MKKSITELKKQLLFETKQGNAFRLKKLEAKDPKAKKAWQTLIDLADRSKDKLRLEIEKQYKGLKAPAKRQSAKSLCRKVVRVEGLKVNGQLKKGYKYQGGKVVKAAPVKKKAVAKKKK